MTMRIAQKLRKITLRDTGYFIQAYSFLLFAALIKTCIPLRKYGPWLGEHCADAIVPPVKVDHERILPIVLAVNRAVRFSPVKSKCLVQALCSCIMLRAHKLPSDFYLGVDKNESRDVIAHAWVKSGQYFIAGQLGHRRYTVISVFSRRPVSGASTL